VSVTRCIGRQLRMENGASFGASAVFVRSAEHGLFGVRLSAEGESHHAVAKLRE